MEGDITEIIEALAKADQSEKMENLTTASVRFRFDQLKPPANSLK